MRQGWRHPGVFWGLLGAPGMPKRYTKYTRYTRYTGCVYAGLTFMVEFGRMVSLILKATTAASG